MDTSTAILARITPVILAGGMGTRLRPVTGAAPKVLATVLKRPVLHYLLDQLQQAGFSRVILATGYRGDVVKTAIGERYQGLAVIYSREDSPMGTGGALRLALEHTWGDTLLAMNGDSLARAPLHRWFAWHFAGPFTASLLSGTMDQHDDPRQHDEERYRFGTLEIVDGTNITGFHEKDNSDGPVNAGVALLSRDIVSRIPAGRKYSLEEDLFPHLAATGRLFCYPEPVPFYDIGTPGAYHAAPAWFSSNPAVSGDTRS